MTKRYFLQSERLGFRQWCEGDLPLATALWGDPEVTKHFDARGQLTEHQVQHRLMQEITCARRNGVQYWPMFVRRDQQFVGCCGLKPRAVERRIYEIGFHIVRDRWRQGFADEASRAVIHYAFETVQAQALFAGHSPANLASGQLLLKRGFRYTHDELYPPTGNQHRSYLLTVDAYRADA